MNKTELEGLRQESIAWNKNHNLTGILAYIEGSLNNKTEARFMQLLEGVKEDVIWIFNRIKNDYRHYEVTILSERHKQELDFPDFSMKCEMIDLNAHPQLTMFFHMDKSLMESSFFDNSNAAFIFLKAF